MAPPTRPSWRLTVPVLLALTALLGALAVWVAFGFATEYADTTDRWSEVAADGVRGWWIAYVVVPVPALAALLGGVRSPRLAVGAVLLLGATVLGVAVASVLGAEVKHDRYPATPSCGMDRGVRPAEPAAAAAEDALAELEHPAPFSGSGDAGPDGCANELVVRHGADPVPAYRRSLGEAGWTVLPGGEVLRAERGGQAFELLRDARGSWTVWVGPRRLEARPLGDGAVATRPAGATPTT